MQVNFYSGFMLFHINLAASVFFHLEDSQITEPFNPRQSKSGSPFQTTIDKKSGLYNE